jgi:hypothetical protein
MFNVTLRRVHENPVAVECNTYYIFECVCVGVCVLARARA